MCAQPRPTLGDPMDYRPPGSPVHGIFQARTLKWVAIFFCKGSSQPLDRTHVLHLLYWQAGSLPTVPPWKANDILGTYFYLYKTGYLGKFSEFSDWHWPLLPSRCVCGSVRAVFRISVYFFFPVKSWGGDCCFVTSEVKQNFYFLNTSILFFLNVF